MKPSDNGLPQSESLKLQKPPQKTYLLSWLDRLSSVPLCDVEAYMRSKRWFRGRELTFYEFDILDVFGSGEEKIAFLLFFLRIRYENKKEEIYSLAFTGEESVPPFPKECSDLPENLSGSWEEKHFVLRDGFSHSGFNRWFAGLFNSGEKIRGIKGNLFVESSKVQEDVFDASRSEIKKMTVEQSNTSLVLGKQRMLKVFRCVEQGVNTEGEMLSFLTRRGFPHIPKFYSAMIYRGQELEQASLGVLTDFVASESDGWAYALRSIQEILRNQDETLFENQKNIFRHLGVVTAGMHLSLCDEKAEEAFQPMLVTKSDADEWKAVHTAFSEKTFAALRRHSGQGTLSALAEKVEALLEREDTVKSAGEHLDILIEEKRKKIRYHGDYHLGQVLKTRTSWSIIDFEGEPMRPLAERRKKACPLRDTAGILRSFDYAAHVSTNMWNLSQEKEPSLPSDTVARWHEIARKAFLEGYYETALPGKPSFLPEDIRVASKLISFFEIEKAVYELYYELNNRPEWVKVPLTGINGLLDAAVDE